ncbi:MAG: hypothetical protein PHR69_03575 [Sphaerochaeta sp.]|nr:hypothetical protein [Sphaerochaeta sp.]
MKFDPYPTVNSGATNEFGAVLPHIGTGVLPPVGSFASSWRLPGLSPDAVDIRCLLDVFYHHEELYGYRGRVIRNAAKGCYYSNKHTIKVIVIRHQLTLFLISITSLKQRLLQGKRVHHPHES